MKEIIGFLANHWGWASAIILSWAALEWKIHGNFSDPAYKGRIERLRRGNWSKFYYLLLKKILVGFTFVFSPLGESTDRHEFQYKYFNCRPFTANSYDRCLWFALGYPIAFVLVGWVFGGIGIIGQSILFSTDVQLWKRLLSIVNIIAFVAMWHYFVRPKRDFTAGLLLFMVFSALNLTNLFIAEELAIVYFLGTFFVVLSFINVNITTDKIAVAAIITTAMGIVGFSLGSSVAGEFPDSSFVRYAGTSIGIYGGILFGAASGILLVKTILTRSTEGRQRVFTTLVALTCSIAALILVIVINDPIAKVSVTAPVLLFLCFLPLANAPLDWMSVGFTRACCTQ